MALYLSIWSFTFEIPFQDSIWIPVPLFSVIITLLLFSWLSHIWSFYLGSFFIIISGSSLRCICHRQISSQIIFNPRYFLTYDFFIYEIFFFPLCSAKTDSKTSNTFLILSAFHFRGHPMHSSFFTCFHVVWFLHPEILLVDSDYLPIGPSSII